MSEHPIPDEKPTLDYARPKRPDPRLRQLRLVLIFAAIITVLGIAFGAFIDGMNQIPFGP